MKKIALLELIVSVPGTVAIACGPAGGGDEGACKLTMQLSGNGDTKIPFGLKEYPCLALR